MKGNYSYITAKITEEMYREEQMELMKDFWHDGSMKELVQTLTHTISKEEKEELKDLINDFDRLKNIYLCHQYDTAEWLVGSISYMCFRKIRQRLEKKGLISMCITVLRGAVLSFLMPIVIVLIYFIYYVYEEDYTMFALSPLVGWVFFVVGIIWTIGFLKAILKTIRIQAQMNQLRKRACVCSRSILDCKNQWKEEVGSS